MFHSIGEISIMLKEHGKYVRRSCKSKLKNKRRSLPSVLSLIFSVFK